MWLGHITQLPDDRTTKKMLSKKGSGKRNKGRAKTKQIDKMDNNFAAVGCEEWTIYAQNRGVQKDIEKKAVGLHGLQC